MWDEVKVPLQFDASSVPHTRSILPKIKYNDEQGKRITVRCYPKRTLDWESLNIQTERGQRCRLPCARPLQTGQILQAPVLLKRVVNQRGEVRWSVSKGLVSAWWHAARAAIRYFVRSITVLVFLTHFRCTCWC